MQISSLIDSFVCVLFSMLFTDSASSKNWKQDLKAKKSALDEIMEMEERRKEKRNRRDNWLHEGIIVKVGIFIRFLFDLSSTSLWNETNRIQVLRC